MMKANILKKFDVHKLIDPGFYTRGYSAIFQFFERLYSKTTLNGEKWLQFQLLWASIWPINLFQF